MAARIGAATARQVRAQRRSTALALIIAARVDLMPQISLLPVVRRAAASQKA
jgi:hypothetical protein